MTDRKVIQIAPVDVGGWTVLTVLCDDGAIFQFAPNEDPPWRTFPPVPTKGVSVNAVHARDGRPVALPPSGPGR